MSLNCLKLSRKIENLRSVGNLQAHFLYPCVKDESATITTAFTKCMLSGVKSTIS